MFKSSLIIAKINTSLTVKFNIIIQSDNSSLVNKFYKSNNNIDELYTFNGSTYYKINPTSFITLDFQEIGSGNNYNPMRCINLNRYQTFIFMKDIKKSLYQFYKYAKSTTPVFWYDKNDLKMDEETSDNIRIERQFQGKTIQMKYTIGVFDTPTGQIKVPGCILYSVSIADSCFIKIDELEYFLDVLEKIDFSNLSMQLFISTELKNKEIENHESSQIHHIPKITLEEKEVVNPNETHTFITPIKDNNTLPDL